MRLVEYCIRYPNCRYENRAVLSRSTDRKCPECGAEVRYEDVTQSDMDRASKPRREGER